MAAPVADGTDVSMTKHDPEQIPPLADRLSECSGPDQWIAINDGHSFTTSRSGSDTPNLDLKTCFLGNAVVLKLGKILMDKMMAHVDEQTNYMMANVGPQPDKHEEPEEREHAQERVEGPEYLELNFKMPNSMMPVTKNEKGYDYDFEKAPNLVGEKGEENPLGKKTMLNRLVHVHVDEE